MAKTSAPSGLTLTRDGRKFSATWKQGAQGKADYDKQNATIVVYRGVGGSVKTKIAETDGKNKTSLSGTVSSNDWQTWTGADYVLLSVWGKASGKDKSDVSTKKFVLNPPRTPTGLSITRDTSTNNTCTVSVTPNWGSDGHYPTTKVVVQKSTNGSTWSTAHTFSNVTSNDALSFSLVESTADVSAGIKRYVRAKAYGPAGNSDWTSSKSYTYGTPAQSSVGGSSTTTTGGNTSVNVAYDVGSTSLVDSTEFQYAICTPAADIATPSDPSWETAVTSSGSGTGSKTSGSVTFSIDQTPGLDQCLYTRINTIYDVNTTYGTPSLVSKGALTAPTFTSLTDYADGQTVFIEAAQNSAVDGAWIEAFCGSESIGDFTGTSETLSYAKCTASGTFGIRAVAGTGSEKMYSEIIWYDAIPAAASNVAVKQASGTGRAYLTWDWAQSGEDLAEVSWSDDPDAWDSTEEPSTFEVAAAHSGAIYVTGLDAGTLYYFRVRLGNYVDGATVWGTYSDSVSITLTTDALTPVLELSDTVIAPSGFTTAYWSYAGEGEQSDFWLYDGSTMLVSGKGAQSYELSGLATGTHSISVVTQGATSAASESSNAVTLTVADPLECSITHGLVTLTETDDDGGETEYTALTALPLAVEVTGMGEGGTAALAIERTEAYTVDRPDESERDGFEGEAVYSAASSGDDSATFSIDVEDLTGYLDDGAHYALVATVSDNLGQTATAEVPFTVAWASQPTAPTATVATDPEELSAFITPANPEANEGDTCDIYRLSADKPVLVISGGDWNETYVDPYPAFGEWGYRIVTRSETGDVITEDSTFAWTDYEASLACQTAVIDFESARIELPYNIELSHSWSKGFTRTTYLNGSIEGDWAAGTERDLSFSTTILAEEGTETMESLRRLAVYEGACHVRTPEGSSFTADVQVSEDADGSQLSSFSLEVSAIDPGTPDGVTLEEWVNGGGNGLA